VRLSHQRRITICEYKRVAAAWNYRALSMTVRRMLLILVE
jgi:hypothetical protein